MGSVFKKLRCVSVWRNSFDGLIASLESCLEHMKQWYLVSCFANSKFKSIFNVILAVLYFLLGLSLLHFLIRTFNHYFNPETHLGFCQFYIYA